MHPAYRDELVHMAHATNIMRHGMDCFSCSSTVRADGRLDAPPTLVEPIGCGCLQLPRMMLKWMKLGMGLGTWTNRQTIMVMNSIDPRMGRGMIPMDPMGAERISPQCRSVEQNPPH